MAMVCPQCNRSFQQHLACPTCGMRLLFHARGEANTEGTAGADPQWQYTPWGRIVTGVILAQGVAHGLQFLVTAYLKATGDDAGQDYWNTPVPFVLLQTLHAFGLLLGGMLAGAGKRRGVFFGSVVGLVHGLVYLGIRQSTGDVLTEAGLYALPALHMLCGAVGGFLGSLIWKPLPAVPMPAADTEPKTTPKSAPRGHVDTSFITGPVAWLRVLLGMAIVVSGVMGASAILKFVLDNGPGRLSLGSNLESQLITWEIAALATFLGASLAGATTLNGFTQGLCVGLGAATVMTGIHLAQDRFNLDQAVLVSMSALFLSAGGGWFGGQLFPPIYRASRRRGPAWLSRAG
jgi:DNA-directed RNA polymerase subunit RPC12/RpoP